MTCDGLQVQQPDDPFGAVLDADAFKVPHEVITAAGRAVVILDDLVAGITEIVRDFHCGVFEPSVDDLQCGHNSVSSYQ
ncbi:MAG: hypothetical protein ACYTFX_11090 [Planctomycetota bacterium]|jgi:hypothetical protein